MKAVPLKQYVRKLISEGWRHPSIEREERYRKLDKLDPGWKWNRSNENPVYELETPDGVWTVKAVKVDEKFGSYYIDWLVYDASGNIVTTSHSGIDAQLAAQKLINAD